MTRPKKMLFNPNATPVVYDSVGHMVAGGDRVGVHALDPAGQEAVDHGVLVLEQPEDDKDQPVEAKASGASAPKKAP